MSHALLLSVSLKVSGKVWHLCLLSRFFLPHPLPPLPRGERGGSTPHPAVHVRERRDHSPRGEWYRAGRTLWQVLEKLCADALPRYKEFAPLMLFSDSYPPVPLSTWKGGTHSYYFDCRLTAGEICKVAARCYKESAVGGRSPRHLTVTRFACFPSPLSPPRRGGVYGSV